MGRGHPTVARLRRRQAVAADSSGLLSFRASVVQFEQNRDGRESDVTAQECTHGSENVPTTRTKNLTAGGNELTRNLIGELWVLFGSSHGKNAYVTDHEGNLGRLDTAWLGLERLQTT